MGSSQDDIGDHLSHTDFNFSILCNLNTALNHLSQFIVNLGWCKVRMSDQRFGYAITARLRGGRDFIKYIITTSLPRLRDRHRLAE